MASLTIILEGPYLRIGSMEMYLDRCTYEKSRGDKLVGVVRSARAIEITVFAYSGERDQSFRPIVTAAHEMVLRG